MLSALLTAAENGDLVAVQSALSNGADINGCAPRTYETPGDGVIVPLGGKPAVYLAVENRHASVAEELLKAGADPDQISEGTNFITGEAPLHLAARRGDLEFAKLLLAGGATPHLKQKSRPDVPGKCALQLAAVAGHVETVRLLLQSGGKPTKNAASAALVDAAEHGRVGITRLLIEHGADVNKPLRPPGWTPLVMACFGGFATVTRVLLEAGAERDLPSTKGMTPLMMAVHGAKMAPENNRDVESPRDHVEVVELLLERGAKADELPYKGKSPIEWARGFAGSTPLVARLLSILEESLQ